MSDVDREKLKQKYGDEQVMVLPKQIVDEVILNGRTGFVIDFNEDLAKIINENAYFIPRYLSDYNPEEVEVIPYVFILNSNGETFFYERVNNSDSRGNNKVSLGIGGHVNIEQNSISMMDIIYKSAERELNEEVGGAQLFSDDGKFIFALIRDLSDSFNMDHLGLVCIAFRDDIAEMSEDKLKAIGYFHDNEIRNSYLYERLEVWSKLIVDNMPILTKKIFE